MDVQWLPLLGTGTQDPGYILTCAKASGVGSPSHGDWEDACLAHSRAYPEHNGAGAIERPKKDTDSGVHMTTSRGLNSQEKGCLAGMTTPVLRKQRN